MLRPNDLVEWFKARSMASRNELSQLTDGIMPGGQIVIGGSEDNARKAAAILSLQQRIGRLTPITKAKLDPTQPTTFDTAAIVQLLMMAKNESFFETIELAANLIRQMTDDGHSVDVALQTLAEQAAQVQKL